MAKAKNRQSKRAPVRNPALPSITLDPLWGSKRMAVKTVR